MDNDNKQLLTKIILILFTVLYVLALAPATLAALFSPMMADAGVTPIVSVLMVSAICLPFTLLLGIVLPWFLYFKKWYIVAILTCLLPIVNGLVLIIVGSMW